MVSGITYCLAFGGSAFTPAQVMGACGSGTFAPTCAAGAMGYCTTGCGGPSETTTYYYDAATLMTFKTTCTSNGGAWGP